MKRAFVIGPGNVGRRIQAALEADGWRVQVVTRRDGLEDAADPSDETPRIVAVREDDLQGVLERLPYETRLRVLLVQNGFLEARLGDLGLVSRGLIYFTAKGDFFKVVGTSVFYGPLAEPIARALVRREIAARVERDHEAFLRAMIVKGLWNSVVGLPLAVHGTDLGTYLENRGAEFESLVEEGARAAGAAYGVEVSGSEAAHTIRETTTALHHVRGGTTALAWRNGAIAKFGRRHGVPTPVNDRLLLAAGYDPSGS